MILKWAAFLNLAKGVGLLRIPVQGERDFGMIPNGIPG
jgi:hypothetical protein